MGKMFEILMEFLKPIVVVYSSIGVFISFLLGALKNPQGFMNSVICNAIDYIAFLFPSTPDNLKIGSFINAASATLPALGKAVIADIFITLLAMAGIALVIKIYKLLPLKAT